MSPVFMHTGTQRKNVSRCCRVPGARGGKDFPARLHTGTQRKNAGRGLRVPARE